MGHTPENTGTEHDRARARAFAAEVRECAKYAPPDKAHDLRDLAALMDRLADGTADENDARRMVAMVEQGEADLARAAADARSAAEDAARKRANYERTVAELRAGLASQVTQRDLIAPIVDAIPTDHPDRLIGLAVLRTAEQGAREAEAALADVDEQERVMRERDAQRAAIRAAIDASANQPRIQQARALAAADEQHRALRQKWAAEDGRRAWRRQRRDQLRPVAARRVPRARARRRGGTRRLARAPASDGSGSDPPSSRVADARGVA